MSFRSKTYDDAAKQAKYDRGLTRFDELIQTPEGLNRLKNMYATNAANAKSREYYGDPNLPFAEQGQPGKRQPFPLSELAEEWDTIVAKPKNQWFHAFNDKKAVGFEFNPKMLDPEYAAWKGATRGTRIYRGDFNNDGYEDIIELDEDDEFRTINGYSKRPSKQALYNEYFKENEATANEFGKPVYPMKFKDWKQEKAAKMDADERKRLNTDLAKIGMAKYKVKEASIAEQVEAGLKEGAYEACVSYLSERKHIDPKLIRKNFRIKSLASHLVRACLHKFFNKGIGANQHEEEKLISKLSRIANKKGTALKNKFIEYLKREK